MNHLATTTGKIPPMSSEAIGKAQALQDILVQAEQMVFDTLHVIHDGVYSRTMMLPAGNVLVGALIKVPTTLIVCGDCISYIDDNMTRLTGYNVLAASAMRKQVFVANTDTWLTMSFRTDLTDIEAIEDYFTDESRLLASRKPCSVNKIICSEVTP